MGLCTEQGRVARIECWVARREWLSFPCRGPSAALGKEALAIKGALAGVPLEFLPVLALQSSPISVFSKKKLENFLLRKLFAIASLTRTKGNEFEFQLLVFFFMLKCLIRLTCFLCC